MTTSTGATITLSNINYRYPSDLSPTYVLSDITLNLAPGSVTLIVGESGCGKSTLLRTMNGLVPHFYGGDLDGEVFAGCDVATTQLHDIGRYSSSIFQNPRTQFFTSYVNTELAFCLENYGVSPAVIEEKIDEAARHTRITQFLSRRIDSLSGGELQRIACACALVAGVDLYFFDEPTSNLSHEAIADFREVITNLKRAGKTLVIAEHRLHLFRNLVDDVYRMNHGRVVEHMTCAELFSLDHEERTKRGLRALSFTDAHVPPAPPSDNGLVLRDVQFSYTRDHPVLSYPLLTFPSGKITAITGHNGVGKSTLARAICGLNKAQGSFEYEGRPLSRRRRRQHCAFVLQDVRRQLFSDTVTGEITLGCSADTDTDHLLEELGLTDVADRHPLSLSGGQAQRLAIATAIAADKRIVIFDEPTSGVDAHHLRGIASLLRQLAIDGRVVIVITHDSELISLCADHELHLEGCS